MVNYADYMAHFNFTVEFKPTKPNAHANYCFRIPLKENESVPKVSSFSGEDNLGKILQLLQGGLDLTRNGYKAQESNYSLSSGCLLFEDRVVIPVSLQEPIIKDLHTAHVGITKMKAIARLFRQNFTDIIGNIPKDRGNVSTLIARFPWLIQWYL